ncbi:GMP synthase (glutamine-hydrolysing) [Pasteurella langaaensis DSM 22999]|uniref:GMP synthase (Glutamine-hydrolysing) n=1 Tax=Alitibacter langaaensis DSM 22999 TaxID=1122935 RepID=A0A2U0TH61_9PAST|nr:type 1 glutamine amidotransferase [Pasteurella langaaensis]PVX42868.1 GMP synthase (glutamine-hydrolysing) [Pasteurella langaaensis DSM 22999]
MQIHFVQHESFEAPGAYLLWAEERGYSVSFSKVYQGDALPSAVENLDILVVLGGPQSPSTTKAECPHFDSLAEQALIKKCVKAGKAVVGVCLGSQLIGEALNAPHSHSPEREIGNFPIQLTEAGKQDKLLTHFGDTLTVGHWHNDMPGLTANVQILAVSKGCPRQIVKYADLVYGFQCHPELNADVVKALIENETDLAGQSQRHQFVQDAATILSFDYREMNAKLYQFLDNLVAAYQSS